MSKAATINTRIEPALKHQAESILRKIGLSTAEAIRIFYIQVCLKKGLPFEVKLPSDETLDAIQELEYGKGTKYDSMKEVWKDVDDA
ncbi:MAG: type II toxin-antitoxin system antitoxin, RelB/DinJ family [Thiotrichales bacterium]|nr:MAG: type II toxin-antitoxin system antitoxin, RelB/DinJ family [Thiotrichales bacterium]